MVKSWSQQVLAFVENSSTQLMLHGDDRVVVLARHLSAIGVLMVRISRARIGTRYRYRELKDGSFLFYITQRERSSVACPAVMPLSPV